MNTKNEACSCVPNSISSLRDCIKYLEHEARRANLCDLANALQELLDTHFKHYEKLGCETSQDFTGPFS